MNTYNTLSISRVAEDGHFKGVLHSTTINSVMINIYAAMITEAPRQ